VGIVHRDLKPENVFLVWDDEDQMDVVKVVDFGIAKFTDTQASGISSATKTGSILGTPYYMSPEQARGLKNLDARSDNWSLGVIAYEALTGTRPFDGEAVGDLLVKICTVDPIPPSQINPSMPPALDEWMKRALCREADGRFQDVTEMAESLITVAGLPGRSTLGSAMGGMDDTTGTSVQLPLHSPRTETHPQGSQKGTSGAVTHAAVGVDFPIGPPIAKTKPMIWIGAAVAVLGLVGAVFALSGGDSPTEEEIAQQESEEAKAAEETKPGSPALEESAPAPEPEKQPEKKVEPPEEAPTPVPAPRPPAARPAPPPAPRPAPQPVVVPAPRPAPAPAPRPSPRPSSGEVDLGY
jgi:serine/threonine-protein kinase